MDLRHKLLVATPRFDSEDGFAQSVIFLLEYDANGGAMGVCINRPAQPCTCGECPQYTCPFFLGGPVGSGDIIMMLHGINSIAKKKHRIIKGVWKGTPRLLKAAMDLPKDDHRFKLFSGCVCWELGQLEEEIHMGLWRVADSTPELVLDADADLIWDDLTPGYSFVPRFSLN